MFHSAYEIKMNDLKLNEDLLNNNERCKDELKVAINNENHRSNVDRAKKKAVTQYMDYDNFHQMVLGADLKGVKMVDVTEMKADRPIMNFISEQQLIEQKKNDMFLKHFVKEKNENDTIKFLVNDKLNLNVFKQNWKKFENLEDKINYFTDNISTEDMFNQLFNVSMIDSDLFITIIFTFGSYILNANESNKKVIYLWNCLNMFISFPYFKKLKMFIGKKHKNVYIELSQKDWFNNSNELINKINIINSILK